MGKFIILITVKVKIENTYNVVHILLKDKKSCLLRIIMPYYSYYAEFFKDFQSRLVAQSVCDIMHAICTYLQDMFKIDSIININRAIKYSKK